LLVYKTNLGEAWCGDSLDLIASLEDNSVDLVVTSPPFALLRQKSYGNESQETYVEWLAQFAELLLPKLKDTGSFVLDIGSSYNKGEPTYSLYQFRVLLKFCDDLGYKLAQPFYWHNTSALPAPLEWVNKRKVRCKNSVNTVWWFSKTPNPKANVRNVLTPYSDRMKKLLTNPEDFYKEGAVRPSGHQMSGSAWTNNNGGAIPPNLLQISNSESNSQYLRCCKQVGIKGHPARFPVALPEFFIKFLTEPSDLVVDIFGGSGTTGAAAEGLGRKWKTFEISREYVATSGFRFIDGIEQSVEVYNELLNTEEAIQLKI
jgi:site-specific DNA-methyltransferase (cytosine-N4-specific)